MSTQIKLPNGTFATVKSRVTKPLVSMAHIQEFFCKVLSEMRESDMELETSGKKGKAQVIDVIDLSTGDEAILICNTIMQSSFAKLEGGIVGRCFLLKAGGIKEGKKYRQIDVYEIDEPTQAEVQAATTQAEQTAQHGRRK